MMECYKKCVNIGKRCAYLGSTGSCADCGKICRSFLTSSSHTCRCNTTPACCQNKTKAGTEESRLTTSAQTGGQDHSRSPSGPGQSAYGSQAQSRSPKSFIQPVQKEKQSFWQWLLSLVGLGGLGGKQEQTPKARLKADTYDSVKSSIVGSQSHKPVEIFSPKAVLEEAKDICNEIKKLKPELYIKEEQSSPPVAQAREEVTEQKPPPPASPSSKKKKKSKQKSPQSSASDRGKYLGRPLESSQKKKSSHTSSPSGRKDAKSPVEKSPLPTETFPAAGDHRSPFAESPKQGAKRPPTSPIYSSERYLQPYTGDLCPESADCQECCECLPTSPDTFCSQHAKGSWRKKQRCARPERSPSAPCTMPCPRSCSVCCSKPCQPVCCPRPCSPMCCPAKPCCCSKCSLCSCLADLKQDMKKRRRSPSPCDRSSPRMAKHTRRQRSSSCPPSPICAPRPCPYPCWRPCPPPSCRPSCALPRSCPQSPTCCPPTRTSIGCGSSCRPSPFKPSNNFCPPTASCCLPPSPGCCLSPCRPPTCSYKPPPCPINPSCPITCMKPCCLPCVYNCPSTMKDSGMSTFKYAPTFSSGTCAVNSHTRSRGNDSFCKQLMAKYNITAPEPRAFCPMPRNTCPPCDFKRVTQMQTFSSSATPGCPSCTTSSCFNNNKSLSGNRSQIFPRSRPADSPPTGLMSSLNNNKPSGSCTSPYAYVYDPPAEYGYSYSHKTCSPSQRPVRGPITFNTSPSHSRSRLEFHIPQRTPVECIKKKGPRSPCKEYMSIHNFAKDSRREKAAKEVATVSETTSPAEAKAVENQQRTSRKSKKRSSSTQPKEALAPKEETGEGARNTSENKAVNENTWNAPSGILTWRESMAKAQRNRSQSRSKHDVKKPRVEEKECQSPRKSSEFCSSYENRYSSLSKSFCPLFLSLSSSSKPSSPSLAKVPLTRIGCRHSKMASPRTLIEEVSATNLGFSNLFSHRPSPINSKLSFTEATNTISRHATPKPIRLHVSRSFDAGLRQPNRNWSFMSTTFDTRSPRAVTESAWQTDGRGVAANRWDDKGEDCWAPLKSASVEKSESRAAIPKVESISSLLKKYDSVEVSALGVMAQSKYNVFEYISADSSSAITTSIKEDPSPSIILELAVEENVKREGDSHAPIDDQGVNTFTPDDPVQDTEEIDREEMKKGTSMNSHDHGDSRRQRDSTPALPKDQADAVKASEAVGGDTHEPPVILKLDTKVRGIKVQNCSHPDVCATGESSVDPAEFGFIGESAVDPIGGSQLCHLTQNRTGRTPQMNQSNNKPFDCSDPKVDALEVTDADIQGEAGAESAASGAAGQEGEATNVAKLEETPMETKLVSGPTQPLDGSEASSEKTSTEATSETDHSNNKPGEAGEPKIGVVIGDGEPSECEDDTKTKTEEKTEVGENEAESKPASALDDLLSRSGVKWSKVTEATEADIKLLHLGKTAFVRRRHVAKENDRDEGLTKAPNPSPVSGHNDPDTKPFLNLLKPGELDSSELCSGTDGFSSESTMDQIRNYGTPV